MTRTGFAGPAGGRMSCIEGPIEYRGTTVQVCGLWPLGVGTATPTVGVPMGASMSTPLWARPPERDAPHVLLNATGPCTGQMMPPTGADGVTVGAGSRSAAELRDGDAASRAAASRASSARRWRSASIRCHSGLSGSVTTYPPTTSRYQVFTATSDVPIAAA